MKRLVLAALVGGLLLPNAVICANKKSGKTPDANRIQTPKCRDDSNGCPLIYRSVGASYVGGTIQEMPLGKGYWPLAFPRALGLWTRQYRVKGHVFLSDKDLLFVFKLNQTAKIPPDGTYYYSGQLCDALTPAPSPDAEEVCFEVDQGITAKAEKSYVIRIPYGSLIELSRAKVNPSDLGTVSAIYTTFAGGVVGSIAGTIKPSSSAAKWAGIAGGALAVGYYYLLERPRAQDNYIALFVQPPCPPPAGDTGNYSAPPNAPGGLTAMPGNARATLSWTASSGATSYNVWRSANGGPESMIASCLDTNTNSYTDRGLINWATYSYAVQVVNNMGRSRESDRASAMPMPPGTGICAACETAALAALAQAPPPEPLFKRGDLIVFKIGNYHDYYNISMILSAKTSLEFVPETAENAGR